MRVVAFLFWFFHAVGMPETTGQRIKRLREERRWTQETLGDLLGVSKKTIGNWENDRHVPQASLGALEKVFSQPLEQADPVEKAIQASGLSRGNKHKLVGIYFDMLDEQGTLDTG